LSPPWAAGWIFNWEQRHTISLSFASKSQQRQVSSPSFPVLLKLIIMLLLLACVNCSRMHATVTTGSLGLDQWPDYFFSFETGLHK
jgi:hypothetical protein